MPYYDQANFQKDCNYNNSYQKNPKTNLDYFIATSNNQSNNTEKNNSKYL